MIIYILSDPETNQIRYIGKTSKFLKIRLGWHIQASKNEHKTYVQKWIKSLLDKGQIPKIIQLQEVNENEIDLAEKKWIKLFKSIGCNLTNLTEGGDGTLGLPSPWTGKILSEEHKRKISEKTKGLRRSPKTEFKKGQIPWIKGKHINVGKSHSEEIRKKISEALKGKSKSEEARKNMSEAKKGKPALNKGKKCSPEICRKISERMKGRIPWNKGIPWSKEIKEKMSKARKGHIPWNKKKEVNP